MAAQEIGTRPFQLPSPNHLDDLLRGAGTLSSASVMMHGDSRKGLESGVIATNSLPTAISDKASFESIAATQDPQIDNPRSCSVLSADSESNTVVIIDLRGEDFGQEPASKSAVPHQTETDSEFNVKFDQAKFIENTQRCRMQQHDRQLNPFGHHLYGDETDAPPRPVSIKPETTKRKLQMSIELQENDTIGTMPPQLPQNLEEQIDEWYDQNPGKLPAFATWCNKYASVYATSKGDPMAYWHKSGQPLEVARYGLPEHLYPASLTAKGYLRLLVAKGKSIQPFIIRFSSSCKDPIFNGMGSAYKAWVGMDTINKDGFEFEPSVFKVPARNGEAGSVSSARRTTEEELLCGRKSSRTNVKTPKPYPGQVYWPGLKREQSQMSDQYATDDQVQADLSQLATAPVEKRPRIQKPLKISLRLPKMPMISASTERMKHAERSTRRRTRQLSDQKILELTSAALSPTSLQFHTTNQQVTRSAYVFEPNQLESHVRKNTVLLFYPDKTGTASASPRPRMLDICDSMSKIFAQASAGSVFPESKGHGRTKVLSLCIDNQHHFLPMVEDDEQDFEAFFVALKEAKCWEEDFGQVRGCCTVEVRAKL